MRKLGRLREYYSQPCVQEIFSTRGMGKPDGWKGYCKLISIISIVVVIVFIIAAVITVAATSLHVDTIILDKDSLSSSFVQVTLPDGQIGYQSVVQKGSQITLRAIYTAQLSFMGEIRWKILNNGTEYTGDTLSLSVSSYDSTLVECRAVYRIGGIVRKSKPLTYTMMNDTSTNYIFYQNTVVHVPAPCLVSCNMTALQVTLSKSGPQCATLQLTNGTSLLLGNNDTYSICGGIGLQHLVIGITDNGNETLFVDIQNEAAPLSQILQDASFTNVSIFASLNDSSLNGTNPPSLEQTSSIVLRQLSQLRSVTETVQGVPSSFNLVIPFNTGDQSFAPVPGVGIAFSASGRLTLNAAISLQASNGNLKVYRVNWSPIVDVTFLGVVKATIPMTKDFSFSLFDAALSATTVFGIFCQPFFSIKLGVGLSFDGEFSAEVVAPVSLYGSFSMDYNTVGEYWNNPIFSSPASVVDKGINITTTFGGCQGGLSITAGPEIGLKFLPLLFDASVRLQRTITFGYKTQNPPPLKPSGDNPGGPDKNINSNAFCNNVGCWCPSLLCPSGTIIPSLSGSYYTTGWNFGLSLSFWKIKLAKYTNKWVSDFYTTGPQLCSPRPLSCANVLPQRCPSPTCPINNLCQAGDCYGCPQPGVENCGTPADHNTPNAIWCAQTYANGGEPYTKPPICFTVGVGGNTCTVRCCGGFQWNQCYFSMASTAHLCNS